MSKPDDKPTPKDELESLEELHRRTKERQEAWRKLLESLGKIEPEPKNTKPEQP